jgi:hypothetical protein
MLEPDADEGACATWDETADMYRAAEPLVDAVGGALRVSAREERGVEYRDAYADVSQARLEELLALFDEDGVGYDNIDLYDRPSKALLARLRARYPNRSEVSVNEKYESNSAGETKLCEHAQYLASYLNTEFDPYDFGSYVGIWPDAEPQWEMFEDVPEDRQAEFIEWVKEKAIPRAHMNDPLSLPAYLFFDKAKTLPAGTWLAHFSRNSFLSFKKGATLETLALSTHANPKTLKSCEANLDPDAGIYETVWGFAIEAEGLSHRDLRGMRNYGAQVMLFQTDCAVAAWHTTDNFEQVIFPLCSEYNVHRGSYDGHALSFEGASGGEYEEFDSLDEVIGAIGKGTLIPNAYDREAFQGHLAGLRRRRDEFRERVRAEIETAGAFSAPMRDERESLRRAGSYRGWVTITRSTRPGIAWQVTFWEGDPAGADAIPTGHLDVSGTLDDAADHARGLVAP